MELDFSQMALELSHHSYLLVTHLTTQEHCCHTSFHAYWYMNVMWSSRLFRVSLFLENASIVMIWGCFSIVSNVIRSNYCCRRHTMHGNMVFSRESIFPTPQQSGCLCVCIVKPLSHCAEFGPRVVASYNSPQLFRCRIGLEPMSLHVAEMSLHVASTRQAATRILNGLKLSCEFSSRTQLEDMSRGCRPNSNMCGTHVFTCRRFSSCEKLFDMLRV